MRNSQWRTFWHVTAKPLFAWGQGPLTKFRMPSHWTSLLIRILGARACPLILSESAISFCFQDIWITNGWQDLLDQNWVVQCRTFMNNAYVHMSWGALLWRLLLEKKSTSCNAVTPNTFLFFHFKSFVNLLLSCKRSLGRYCGVSLFVESLALQGLWHFCGNLFLIGASRDTLIDSQCRKKNTMTQNVFASWNGNVHIEVFGLKLKKLVRLPKFGNSFIDKIEGM